MIVLRCTVCHTDWTEACWAEWQTCPTVDCQGTLRKPVVPKPVKVTPPRRTFPLFEAKR